MMNDPAALAGMIPFDSIGLYEQPKPRFIFKMPRVVPDQKSKFESDELFKKLSRESEVRYTGYRDRPQEERQVRFQNGCREGHTEISFITSGTNLQLIFNPNLGPYVPEKECDFEKEFGKIRYTGYRDRPQDERQIRFQNACREGHTELSFVPSGTNLQLVFNPNHGIYTQERECDFDKEHGKVHIKSHFIMNGVCVKFRGWVDLDRLDGVGCLEYDERRAIHEDAILREQIDRYNQRLRDFEDKQRSYRGDRQDVDGMEQMRRGVSGGIGVGVGGGMWRR